MFSDDCSSHGYQQEGPWETNRSNKSLKEVAVPSYDHTDVETIHKPLEGKTFEMSLPMLTPFLLDISAGTSLFGRQKAFPTLSLNASERARG